MDATTCLPRERQAAHVAPGDVLVNDRAHSQTAGKRWQVISIISVVGQRDEDVRVFALDDGSRQARLASEYVTVDPHADPEG